MYTSPSRRQIPGQKKGNPSARGKMRGDAQTEEGVNAYECACRAWTPARLRLRSRLPALALQNPRLGRTQRAPRTCRALCGGRKQSGCCHNNPAMGRAPGPPACPAARAACFSVAQKGSGGARRTSEALKNLGGRPPTCWRRGVGNMVGDVWPSASGGGRENSGERCRNYENRLAEDGARRAGLKECHSAAAAPDPLGSGERKYRRHAAPRPRGVHGVQAGLTHARVHDLRPAQPQPAQAQCPVRACRRPRTASDHCCGRRNRFRRRRPRRRQRRTRQLAAAARPAPEGAPPAHHTASRHWIRL